MEYYVCEAYSIDRLKEEVEEKLNMGWKLQGSVQAFTIRKEDESRNFLAQYGFGSSYVHLSRDEKDQMIVTYLQAVYKD